MLIEGEFLAWQHAQHSLYSARQSLMSLRLRERVSLASLCKVLCAV